MPKFITDHWKIIALGALLLVAFVLGLVLGHNLSAVSAGSGVVGLIAGWLHKSPGAAIKSADAAVTAATRVADDATRQVTTDQRATAAGAGNMDKLLDGAGTTVAQSTPSVAGSGESLLDASKELGAKASG